ncbi:MAG: dephospho-CoA kinase [Gammaproteobacteria bacterium]|nr:dephospho-CoA kinase [Gammaproteobacteria bacterium]
MLVIGLTGGIGSGKSTVAELFRQHHVPIIDADVIAREVTQAGTPLLLQIAEHFGNEILLNNGSLDRAKLRQIIFHQPNQRLWLENLLHPIIREEMQQKINKLSSPYCIAMIPLLLEVEFYSFINRILVIDAPEQLQIERTALRDKAQKSQIEIILKAQAKREYRLAHAQDIIINDGKIEDLIPQVEKLHQEYLKMADENTKGL